MLSFSLIPPIEIKDDFEKEIDSDLIKKLKISNSCIEIDLVDSYYEKLKQQNYDVKQSYKILAFDNKSEVHQRIGPENLPLELLYFSSVDFIESLSIFLKTRSLIYPDPPENGIFDFFYSPSVANLIEKPDLSSRYTRTHILTPLSNLITSVHLFSDDYENYLENALKTFQENILNPAKSTVQEIMDRSKNEPLDETELKSVKIQRADLLNLIEQTSNLVTIIENQMNLLRERNRLHLHLIAPFTAHTNLLSVIKDHVDVKITGSMATTEIVRQVSIKADEIASFIEEKIKELSN